MIALLILCAAFVLGFFNPKRATLAVALISAFWFEWELPIGGRLGLFEMLFLGGILGLLAGNGGARAPGRTPCLKLVTAYIAISFISYVSVHVADDPLKTLWGVFKPVIFAASYFLFYRTIDDEAFLKKVIGCFFISATVSALIGVAQHFLHNPLAFLFTGTYVPKLLYGWIDFEGSVRANSSLEHPVTFGTFMVLPPVLMGAMMWTNPERWRRKRSWFMLGAVSLGLLLSFTRAAWVSAFVAGLGVVVLLKAYRERRFQRLTAWAVASLILVVASGRVPAKYFDRLKTLEDAKNDPAMMPRYQRWAYFYERSLQKPWLGWGAVTDAETMKTLEYAASPHNTWLFLAVQRGWLATGIMIAILLALLKEGWAAIKAAPSESYKGLAAGLFMGAAGMFAIGGFFDPLFEDYQCSVVFWILLAITFRLRPTFSERSAGCEDSDAEHDPAPRPADSASEEILVAGANQ